MHTPTSPRPCTHQHTRSLTDSYATRIRTLFWIALSGFVFPVESLPDWLRPVTNAIPAKWFVLVTRGIMLKGAGLTELWDETLVLAGMSAVLLAAGIRSAKARLE